MTPPLQRQTASDSLYQHLRQRLQGRRNGFRLPAEAELTQGASIGTLRKALARLAEEGWVAPAEGKGWKVTAKARGNRVAIVNDVDLVAHPSQTRLYRIREAERSLRALGHDTSLYLGTTVSSPEPPSGISCPQFHKDLEEGWLSGVLGLWGYLGEPLTARLKEANIPVVGLAAFYEEMVTHDTLAYVSHALDALARRGRRKVAYIGAISSWNFGGEDHDRPAQICRKMAEKGLEVREQWIRQDWHPSISAGRWSAFRELWTSHKDRPDALILNSAAGWQEIRTALESFRLSIPEDLDVVLPREKEAPIAPGVALEFSFDTDRLVSESVGLLHARMSGQPVATPRLYLDAWREDATPAAAPLPFEPPLSLAEVF